MIVYFCHLFKSKSINFYWDHSQNDKKGCGKIFSKEIAKIQFLQNICWCQDRQSYRRFLVKPNLRKLIPAKCSKKISEYLRGSFGKFWKLGMLCYSLKTLPNFEFSHHFRAKLIMSSSILKSSHINSWTVSLHIGPPRVYRDFFRHPWHKF